MWTLTNDTSYNETSLTKCRFGHRFELKLDKESRLITEMLCVDRESVTSVTNWARLNVTSSERRPDCSFRITFFCLWTSLNLYDDYLYDVSCVWTL